MSISPKSLNGAPHEMGEGRRPYNVFEEDMLRRAGLVTQVAWQKVIHLPIVTAEGAERPGCRVEVLVDSRTDSIMRLLIENTASPIGRFAKEEIPLEQLSFFLNGSTIEILPGEVSAFLENEVNAVFLEEDKSLVFNGTNETA